jgi:hypothetical protein
MAHTFRVNRKQLEIGTRTEAKEHTWASRRIAKRIAKDHLKKEGPMAYPFPVRRKMK